MEGDGEIVSLRALRPERGHASAGPGPLLVGGQVRLPAASAGFPVPLVALVEEVNPEGRRARRVRRGGLHAAALAHRRGSVASPVTTAGRV
jgi:hypothetical protein